MLEARSFYDDDDCDFGPFVRLKFHTTCSDLTCGAPSPVKKSSSCWILSEDFFEAPLSAMVRFLGALTTFPIKHGNAQILGRTSNAGHTSRLKTPSNEKVGVSLTCTQHRSLTHSLTRYFVARSFIRIVSSAERGVRALALTTQRSRAELTKVISTLLRDVCECVMSGRKVVVLFSLPRLRLVGRPQPSLAFPSLDFH